MPSPAEEFARRFGGDVCETLDDLLGRPDVEAVYIGTHPDTHAEMSILALRAGKHALCEKPSAINVKQLQVSAEGNATR